MVSAERVSLSTIRKGTTVRVTDIPQGRSRAQMIRLGIVEGVVLKCLERLPGGTIVVQKQRQEIAIGASLSRVIMVAHADTKNL